MKLGMHLSNLTFGVDPSAFASTLDEIVAGAEAAGFDRISVMDHYFQIPNVGPAEHEMFEAYGLLSYLAARTSRVRLGVLTTGVTYREPGFLAKQIAGLDVLSGGRAWAGLGAAWYEREHLGLGFPFPPLRERFERLEEAVQICLQMWSEENGSYEGRHYRLAETLCVPRPIQRPGPPLMIAGSGERKTLRLVARYADACNVRGSNAEDVQHLMEVLDGHCEDEGRDPATIERTIVTRFDPGPAGERAAELVDRLGRFAEVGVQAALGSVVGAQDPRVLAVMGESVIPQVADL